jgi:hypothetical protein
MSDREQFEAHWCRDVPSMYRNAALAEAKANRDGDRYKRDEVQWAWEAWQASRRAALEECWGAVHGERLEEPTETHGDIAYERAIEDCENAIRALAGATET